MGRTSFYGKNSIDTCLETIGNNYCFLQLIVNQGYRNSGLKSGNNNGKILFLVTR